MQLDHFAVEGLDLTFSFEEYIAPQIASGALVRVLEDWCPPFPGYFLVAVMAGVRIGALEMTALCFKRDVTRIRQRNAEETSWRSPEESR